MKIIGISGKIGTGKTTVANHLLDMLPGNWKRIAFGDVLKQEVSEIYRIPVEWAYTNKNCLVNVDPIYKPPAKITEVREVLQWHGTEVRRAQDPEYWVKKMREKIIDHPTLDGIIIDDVRFPDEADLVRELGGLSVRLSPFGMWRCDKSVAKHTSETALDSYLHFDLNLCPSHGKLKYAAEAIFNLV